MLRLIVKVLCFTILLYVAGFDVLAAYHAGDKYSFILCTSLLVILLVTTIFSFGD